MFDLSDLKTVISESAPETSEMLISRINSRLRGFVQSDELQDDATTVAINVKLKILAFEKRLCAPDHSAAFD